MKDKLNFVFKPFVLALIVLTIGYTFVHWLFFIELNLFSLKKSIIGIGVPIVLSGVTAWLFLYRKLKALDLKASRGDWRDFYCVIAWIALTIPLIIAQEYMVTATGKLTELSSIKEINNFKLSKYYTLESFHIHKNGVGFHSAFDVSGKHNEDFNMEIYIAMPIFESEKDTTDNDPPGWLCVKYRKTVGNWLKPDKKEAEYRKFAEQCQRNFTYKDVSKFVYLERITDSDDREGYVEAVNKNPVYKPNRNIFIGIDEAFEARNGKKLHSFLVSASIGSLIWLIMILIPRIDKKQLERIKAGKPDKATQKEIRRLFDFLKPEEGRFVTLILMYINISVFMLMAIKGLGFFSFKGEDLLNWGANYRPLTKNGEWWRLITSIFLHGGLMHILTNMYALLFVGFFLEPLLGKRKLLIVYMATGIVASIASIWWYEATVSVGASGAIFGLYGVLSALLLTKIYPPDFAKPLLTSIAFFIGYNLLMGLAGGIDNAAHIGGIASGFITGFILYPMLNRK